MLHVLLCMCMTDMYAVACAWKWHSRKVRGQHYEAFFFPPTFTWVPGIELWFSGFHVELLFHSQSISLAFFILLYFLSMSSVLFVTQEPGDLNTVRKTYRGWWFEWNDHFGTRQSRKVAWLSGIVCTEYATWVLFLAKQQNTTKQPLGPVRMKVLPSV